MLSIKSRYSVATINTNSYTTLKISGLTDEEFKAGKQGYVYTPYIMAESTNGVIDLPPHMIAEMKRDNLRKKLQKIKNCND